MITSFSNRLMLWSRTDRPPLWLVSLTIAISLGSAGFLFAAGAQAQVTSALESSTDLPADEAPPEGGVPPGQTLPITEEGSPAGAQVPATVEQAPPAEDAPPVAEQAPSTAEEGSPAAEQAPSAPEQAGAVSPAENQQSPPIAEDQSPAAEQTPPAAEETPPAAEQTPPIDREIPPTSSEGTPSAPEQKTPEQAGGASGEASSEGDTAEGAGDSQMSTGASGTDHREPTNEAATGSLTDATAPNAALTTSGVSTLGIPTAASGENQALASVRPPTALARQAQQVSRELAAFGALTIGSGYAVHWLEASGATLVSTIAFAADDASPAAIVAASAPARDKGRGAGVENRPSPIPGSGGAGGGSAAGGGSGTAPSASFILVGALLQTAPSVMRRLCLSQPSWRTTFFALIPERPG